MSFLEGDPGHGSTEEPTVEAAALPEGSVATVAALEDLPPLYAIRAGIDQVRFHRDEANRPGMPEFNVAIHLEQKELHLATLATYGIGPEDIPETSLADDAFNGITPETPLPHRI